MQTTLLGLAIAFILALIAALIGPYFVDWNQFRPQFEAEASRIIGAPVRVAGKLDARLLPTPTLRLHSLTLGGANDLGKLRADRLNVEFSLGSLMRGQWRATELTVNGAAVDLGLDARGRIDLPATNGTFDLASLAIDRLSLTGRIALHDAASRTTLELNDVAFSGDVRSLAGSVRGDGNFKLGDARYPFRITSAQTPDGGSLRVHLTIDPGDRPVAADLDGVLAFETRIPHFDGAVSVAVPPSKPRAGEAVRTTWKVTARVKADPAGAKFDQVEASYGGEDSALKLAGTGEARFGASPLLHAVLSARQLDADRFMASSEPIRVLPALRAALAAIPQPPIPAQIEFSSEQIMLGGRPLQNIAAELHVDGKSWTFHRLDLRAPGATQITLNGAAMRPGVSDSLSGKLSVESSDPDTLVAWLQGRSEVNRHSQKPLRLNGNVTIAANHLAIEALRAEFDGGAVDGRVAFSQAAANKGSRIEAEFKADRLDLDAASSFVRSLAGPQGEWPDEAKFSLDIGRALSAGQELRPFTAKVGYSPTTLSLEQLQFGRANGVTTDATGHLDRTNATGQLKLQSTAASLGEIAGLITPIVPVLGSRLEAVGNEPGPARLKLDLSLDKNQQQADHVNARAVLDINAPQLKGVTTLSAQPLVAAIRDIDVEKLRNSEFTLQSKLSSERASALLALLGLDRVVAAGQGTAQFESSVSGAWHRPLQLKARISGGGVDAEAQGTAEPFASEPSANANVRVRNVNLMPLFGASDKSAQNVSLSSRVTLAGNKLTFDDLDSSVAGSRLRGRLAMTFGPEKSIDGEVGLDTLDLGPAFAAVLGAAGQDVAEPLTAGFLKGWRSRIAFEALRGTLPGGSELRPVSGTIKSDGQSITLDPVKGSVGGGEVSASIDARESVKEGANGLALNARVEFSGVDGAALRYRGLAMPKGRTSLQMALSTEGRSAAALTGALSGNGTLTLESAEIKGLDPRAFDVAIHASDSGQAADDNRLRQIVEPALSAGPLLIGPAQIPFTIRDGRLRVSATTLEGKEARAIVSGGYDIPADQADIRANLASTVIGSANSRPEIQLLAAGSPDKLHRMVDLTSLSSWLAVRAIDRETRRLDAIERGEPPPATAALPSTTATPDGGPKPPAAPNAPAKPAPKPRPAVMPAAPNAPMASQQLAPLPPPIEVKPAPGPAPVKPKPRTPLILTPPSNP